MSYTPNSGEEKLAYDTDQLRDVAGIGKTKIFAEMRAGRLKARRLGRKLLFRHDDVMAWLNSLPERPTDVKRAA